MKANIPIHAHVTCIDGDAGTSIAVIVDPVQRRLTHVVVREHGLAGSERLVSMDLVDETTEGAIRLRCTRDELRGLESFIEAHFVNATYETLPYRGQSNESSPYPMVTSERIPPGEVALRRSSVVEATDGIMGHVESLVIDTEDHHITHVVVRTSHWPLRHEVAVPVAQIERFVSGCVMLRVGRRSISNLPHLPLHDASLLPVLASTDLDLVPESPGAAGVDDSGLDTSHVEGAHLPAEEVGAPPDAVGTTRTGRK